MGIGFFQHLPKVAACLFLIIFQSHTKPFCLKDIRIFWRFEMKKDILMLFVLSVIETTLAIAACVVNVRDLKFTH